MVKELRMPVAIVKVQNLVDEELLEEKPHTG